MSDEMDDIRSRAGLTGRARAEQYDVKVSDVLQKIREVEVAIASVGALSPTAEKMVKTSLGNLKKYFEDLSKHVRKFSATGSYDAGAGLK